MTVPAGFGEITIEFAGTQLPHGGAVTFGIDNSVGASALEAAQFAALAWAESLLAIQCDNVHMARTICKLGPDETGPSAEYTGETGPGGDAGDGNPPQISYLLQKTTDSGGRRGKGRMYVPGVTQGRVSDAGVVNGAFLITINTACGDFMESLAGNDIPMVLLHGPATEWVLVDGQPRRVPVAGAIPDPTPVVALSCESQAATQRRRAR